jgi:hypothetical protein
MDAKVQPRVAAADHQDSIHRSRSSSLPLSGQDALNCAPNGDPIQLITKPFFR